MTVRWVGLALCLAGCSSSEESQTASGRPSVTSTATASSSRVARPDRIPYLDFHAEKGCHAYWHDPTTEISSERREVRCPREMVAGERMRLSGRVCFRESSDAPRRGPVRCAYQLIKIQEALRTGEGEWDLAPLEED